jgi:hypothetical protein
MNKAVLTCKIRTEGATEENCLLFSKTYSIFTPEIKELITEYIINKNRKVLEYYRKMDNCGIPFSIEQYYKLKEFRKENYKDSSSLEFFKACYGDSIGEEFFNKKCEKTSGSLTSFIKRHGKEEGTQKYNEANKLKATTLENFIAKYGKKDGTKKWNSFCERNKGNFSLERMVELYGDEEGTRKYEELQYKLKNKNTLEYYIDLYGEEGVKKYEERNLKNSKSSKLNSIRVIGTPAYEEYRKKKEENGEWLSIDDMTDFQLYYRKVWNETKKQPLHTLKNYEKRGHQRQKGTYAIDHIISIKYGYINNVCYKIVGNINNLQMLSHSENSHKNDRCYSVIGAR